MKEGLEEGVRISYGGQEVQSLSLLRLRLFNSGSQTIRDADIRIRLNAGVKILQPRFKMKPESATGENIITFQPSLVLRQKTFHIKYLKPFKAYKQWIGIDLIYDGEIRDLDISGDGEGWTVKPPSAMVRERKRLQTALYTIFGVSLLALLAGTFLLPSSFLGGDHFHFCDGTAWGGDWVPV